MVRADSNDAVEGWQAASNLIVALEVSHRLLQSIATWSNVGSVLIIGRRCCMLQEYACPFTTRRFYGEQLIHALSSRANVCAIWTKKLLMCPGIPSPTVR